MGRTRAVEAEWAAKLRDLRAFLGPSMPVDRTPRVLGLFAHPDDEVFCAGGTLARCAAAGAVTRLVSLTQGDAGQIRDATAATRRTLGPVRVKELEASASALGVDEVTCLDLGDGRLMDRPRAVSDAVRAAIEEFEPDVVVTFGPDGGFGHPDHVASCLAALEVIRSMAAPPRLLHAKFPVQGQLMIDLIIEWLADKAEPFNGSAAFAHALKLFADGTSVLGVTADHVRVEWYPSGSFIIEQGEPARELYCLLSGTADVVYEHDDGSLEVLHTADEGDFVGDQSLRSALPQGAHVIAREPATCLVFAPEQPSPSAGRGQGAVTTVPCGDRPCPDVAAEDCLIVNVRPVLGQKVEALAAHRSQYALEPDLLPMSMVQRLLGVERFVVAVG